MFRMTMGKVTMGGLYHVMMSGVTRLSYDDG